MIVKNLKWFSCLLIGLIIIAVVVGLLSGGLNLGIDFTGGSLVTVDMGEEYDSETVRQAALAVEGISGDVSVVKAGENMQQAIIRLQSTGDEAATAELVESMMNEIQKTYAQAQMHQIDSVGGTASGDLISSAITSVLLAGLLMLIYIWIRFDLFSGIGALAALIHDVIAMIAVMCIFQVQIDSTFIAAALTIVGYSINDTVIIFDRIRENMNTLDPKKYSKDKIVDMSVRQTLGRTINTSVTTLIMITALYIFGVQSIKIFAFPIIIGIVIGTFSSNLIAPAIWIKLLNKFGHKFSGRKRVKPIR